jgi:hypothetical protein
MTKVSNGLAPLRAADWRFLLPEPTGGRFDHLVLLGAAPGLAARAAELGLARRVSEGLPADRSADAVVALHSARSSLADLTRALVPGGALYREINRRSFRSLAATPGRLRQALTRAGLGVTGIYALGPSVHRPRVYLPLDVSGALRWYLDTLYNPWTRPLGWVEMALRALTRLDPDRFAPLAPGLVVTAVLGPAPRPASLLEAAIRQSGLEAETLRPLMLTSTHYETLSQRVVALPFTADGVEPVAAVKLSKSAGLNPVIEREQSLLAEIRARLDPALRRTIPEPLHLGRVAGLTVAAESYLPGESLQRATCRWDRSLADKLEDLRLAAQWLAAFHRQTTTERAPWGPDQRRRWLTEPIEQYRATFGETGAERVLFARAEEWTRGLERIGLPIVLRKPDFFGSNVVRSGARLSVLDWESSYAGPALCDLLRFIVPWADVASGRRGRRTENFRRLFFGSTDDPLVRGVHQIIAGYLDALEMDRALFPVLLLYTWIERAIHHVEKQKLQSALASDRRAGNRHAQRVDILAEEVDRLFGAEPARPHPDPAVSLALEP